MQDVALAAGVHRATVSRALRNDPRIPEETRIRIREMAESIGYRTNALVAALMSHRRAITEPTFSAVIAYVTRFEKAGAWRSMSESFGRIYDGAEASAAQQGYKLEEFCLNTPKLTCASFSKMLRARGIHGIVIAPLPRSSGHLRLDWESFASVTVGFSVARPELHRVATDHFACLVAAARQCRKRGYRRLGLLLTGWVNERTDRRWLGAHLVETLPMDASLTVPPLVTREFDAEAFRQWFNRHRPEVLLGVHMYRVLPVLKKMGVRVPEDVGVVSLELREREAGLSGMNQNFEQVGASAVNTVISMLHRGERGLPAVPQKILLDATWVEGGSLLRKTSETAEETKS